VNTKKKKMKVKKSNINDELLLSETLKEMKAIILSQIEKPEDIYTVSLHVYSDTQVKTMIEIFTNYDKSSFLYQEALKILKN
jgi:hypothetical protein